MSGYLCSPVSATVCGAPIFSSAASGVAVEPFCSTIVNSEIVYQCQTGFLPEERRTLLCEEDGRWSPDPQSLCTGIKFTYPSIQICPHRSLLLFQTKVCLQLLLQPLQLSSAHWWCSLLGLCVVRWSLSVSAGGIRRDVALSQQQTHKNGSKQL